MVSRCEIGQPTQMSFVNFTSTYRGVNVGVLIHRFLNVKVVVAAFNQEKALVGVNPVITKVPVDLRLKL